MATSYKVSKMCGQWSLVVFSVASVEARTGLDYVESGYCGPLYGGVY